MLHAAVPCRDTIMCYSLDVSSVLKTVSRTSSERFLDCYGAHSPSELSWDCTLQQSEVLGYSASWRLLAHLY